MTTGRGPLDQVPGIGKDGRAAAAGVQSKLGPDLGSAGQRGQRRQADILQALIALGCSDKEAGSPSRACRLMSA